MSKSVAVKALPKKYASRSAFAKAMVAAGKSISVAAQTAGITYATVFAITKGADKTKARVKKYRAEAKKAAKLAKKVSK